MAGMGILAAVMVYTWRREGLSSPHFWWSLLIVLVWAATVLTFRWWRERNSASNGSHRSNNQQPSGLN